MIKDNGNVDNFNGLFTPYFRNLLKLRRKSMHHSYADVAHILDVSTSAVRKWECGLSLCCRQYQISKIQAYLRGQLISNFNTEIKQQFTQKEWQDFTHTLTCYVLKDARIQKYKSIIKIIGIQCMQDIIGLCVHACAYHEEKKQEQNSERR